MVAWMVKKVGYWAMVVVAVSLMWLMWGKPLMAELGIDSDVLPGAVTVTLSPVEQAAAADESSRALALLDGLEVKGRAPKTGYDRELFYRNWTDTNQSGCDTRKDVLIRDRSAGTVTKCAIEGPSFTDPYTGEVFTDASDLDIDHVVALGNSWQTGAFQWDAKKRAQLAQDPQNLLAVSASANRQKGDGDAATWLPSNKGYRCTYVATQIQVKSRYGLWVTAPEKAAMGKVLDSCAA